MNYDRIARQPAPPQSAVSALCFSAIEDDHAQLGEIFSHSNWNLYHASNLAEALTLLRAREVAVVIASDLPPGMNWGEFMELLRVGSPSPRIVAALRFSETSRWSDALQRGVFDVLAKPFDAREVFQVAGFAWMQWQRETERKHQASRMRVLRASA